MARARKKAAKVARPAPRTVTPAPRSCEPIVLDVLGTPAPKGSGRAIMRGGRAIYVPSGSDKNKEELEAWDVAVKAAAHAALGDRELPLFVETALEVTIIFRLARPQSHYLRGVLRADAPRYSIRKPDASKLLRATEDSLTGLVYDDDARIVVPCPIKEYADPHPEGARIVVREWIDA